jgi:carbonic anhydrase/acetyltransferase-like protein (isoleucine patch superfamily)
MSEKLQKQVKVGERVVIHGLKRRGSDVLVAISITTTSGAEIIDSEPEEKF